MAGQIVSGSGAPGTPIGQPVNPTGAVSAAAAVPVSSVTPITPVQTTASSSGNTGPAGRQGLNGSFSYVLPNSAAAQVYRVRVLGVGYGSIQLANETMSRTRRAFYPRNVVASTFLVQICLIGVDERASFSNYIQNYANNYLSPQASFPPIMTFTCQAMNISQTGIPTDGFEWGNSVGAMMWTPTISIQPTDASFTPTGTQRTGGSGFSDLNQASFNSVLNIAPEVKYFIPQGTQLTGDQAPPDGNWNTSSVIPLSPTQVDKTVLGGPHPISDPVAKGLGGV